MTAETDSHPPTEPFAAHEPARRGGSIGWCCWWRPALVGAAVGADVVGRAQAAALYPRRCWRCSPWSACSSCSRFAAGIIRFADRAADDPVMGRIADHAYDGLVVTDPQRPRGLCQRRLSGADRGRDARRTCGRSSASSSAIPTSRKRCSACSRRRAKASGSRRRCASPGLDGAHGALAADAGAPARRRASARRKYAVWSIADVTRDRERQENIFQELQHAIEYLDHAPCRLLLGQSGRRHRLSQRHAGELARSRPGAGRLGRAEARRHRLRRRRGAADHDRGGAGRGQDRGVRHRPARCAAAGPCRCGSITSSRSAPTARPAPRARWCSTARATSIPIPQRAAEVRFMRFFDHTPMAIATVDRGGAVVARQRAASPSWRRASARTARRASRSSAP